MKCFKDHESDSQTLNSHTLPISKCEKYFIEEDGKQVEVCKVPILTGEGLWRILQEEAEEIVAPGGVLIADPRERNRAINAAYARLWLHDNRFQWAGLAAFASKQVGCGLLHAADVFEKIQADYGTRQHMVDNGEPNRVLPDVEFIRKFDEQQYREFDQALTDNPLAYLDYKFEGEELSYMQDKFKHVYDMMALGNTTLFLDVFPLHAFYAKRGFKEFEQCLGLRESIFGHPQFPVLWPIDQNKLKFGFNHPEILQAFTAIEAGEVDLSVRLLALHEQKNILQPALYSDEKLVDLLRRNHFAYATSLLRSVTQPIELTLSSQCQAVDDGRTIGFSRNPFADLSDLAQRMPFVLRAAKQFDELLQGNNRDLMAQEIKKIAMGTGGQ